MPVRLYGRYRQRRPGEGRACSADVNGQPLEQTVDLEIPRRTRPIRRSSACGPGTGRAAAQGRRPRRLAERGGRRDRAAGRGVLDRHRVHLVPRAGERRRVPALEDRAAQRRCASSATAGRRRGCATSWTASATRPWPGSAPRRSKQRASVNPVPAAPAAPAAAAARSSAAPQRTGATSISAAAARWILQRRVGTAAGGGEPGGLAQEIYQMIFAECPIPRRATATQVPARASALQRGRNPRSAPRPNRLA